MMRLNIVLAFVLLVSSLALVTTQHNARKKFIDLERAQAQAKQIETQWEQLQVEQSQLTKSALIDTKARRDLHLQALDPSRTLHFTLGQETAAVTAWKQTEKQNQGVPRP
jgi:cell division protein FtsL